MGAMKERLIEAEENGSYLEDRRLELVRMIDDDYKWCKQRIADIGDIVAFAISKRMKDAEPAEVNLGKLAMDVVHSIDHLDAMHLHLKQLVETMDQEWMAEHENEEHAEDYIKVLERKLNSLKEQGVTVEWNDSDF